MCNEQRPINPWPISRVAVRIWGEEKLVPDQHVLTVRITTCTSLDTEVTSEAYSSIGMISKPSTASGEVEVESGACPGVSGSINVEEYAKLTRPGRAASCEPCPHSPDQAADTTLSSIPIRNKACTA